MKKNELGASAEPFHDCLIFQKMVIGEEKTMVGAPVVGEKVILYSVFLRVGMDIKDQS
jgi:hypothetical protein